MLALWLPCWLPLDLGQGILIHLSPCWVGPTRGQSAEVTGDFSAFSLQPGVPSCSHEPSLVLSLYSQKRICRCVSGALVFLFYLLTTYIKCKLWSLTSLVSFSLFLVMWPVPRGRLANSCSWCSAWITGGSLVWTNVSVKGWVFLSFKES